MYDTSHRNPTPSAISSRLRPALRHSGTLVLCTVILLMTLQPASSTRAANKLPTVTMSPEAAACLKGADWPCSVELLIPEYERRGDSSGLQFYIAHAFRRLAHQAFEDNDLARARELLEQAIAYNDTEPILYAELGRIHLEQSRYEDAAHSFGRAFELDGSNPKYAETLAQIHYLSGSLTDAIDFLEQAIELSPEQPGLQTRLAQMREKQLSETNGTTQISQVFQLSVEEGVENGQINTIWKMLEEAWYRVGLELDFYPKRQIAVYLLSPEKFKDATGVPSWSGGVYEGRISLPFQTDQPGQIEEIITHEYTHALLYDAMAYRCPWWLNEGLAQYLSLSNQKRLEVILTAIREHKQTNGWSKSAPDLAELNGTIQDSRQAALSYGLALSATEYLIERYTQVTLRAILHAMAEGQNFEEALLANTGDTFAEFRDSWWNQL